MLYSFGACTDGALLRAGLINVKGTLYGTTEFGGTSGHGTVFSLSPCTLGYAGAGDRLCRSPTQLYLFPRFEYAWRGILQRHELRVAVARRRGAREVQRLKDREIFRAGRIHLLAGRVGRTRLIENDPR